MRKTLILAAGLALVTTSAFSQTSSREREDGGGRGWYEGRGGGGGAERGRDFGEWRGRVMREHDESRGGESGGAKFFLRSGDTQLRVVCGDRESTRSCVDAALLMLDRVKEQGSTTRAPTSPGSSQ